MTESSIAAPMRPMPAKPTRPGVVMAASSFRRRIGRNLIIGRHLLEPNGSGRRIEDIGFAAGPLPRLVTLAAVDKAHGARRGHVHLVRAGGVRVVPLLGEVFGLCVLVPWILGQMAAVALSTKGDTAAPASARRFH